MPNTYTQLYVHLVFAVKYRAAVIRAEWEEDLHKYITGIVQHNHHKLLAINSAYDHLHLFLGLHPTQSISELMRQVKVDSSEWINKHRWTKRKFYWQDGYGAFSNSRSQIDGVVNYIIQQKEHHQQKTFRLEYLELLRDYAIDFDERYIFHEPLEG